MKKNLERTIELPNGFEAKVDGGDITIKGKGKELTRKFRNGKVSMKVIDGKIKLSAEAATRRESKMIGTMWAHINNMIEGLGEDYEYKMEICNVHFPMNVKAESGKVVIKSFLGEKTERKAKILPNVKVEVRGNEVIVRSFDLEAAGQTAANIEKATRLKGRDRRVFQDGIFITSKPGREF